MSIFGNEYIVYRYTDKTTGNVVYIGKTNSSLSDRVNAHKREESFEPYDCEIDFTYLSNEVETDSVEKLLINYYKPVINIKDNLPTYTEGLSLPNLCFVPYEQYLTYKAKGGRRALLFEEAMRRTGLVYALLDGYKNSQFKYNIDTVVAGLNLVEKDVVYEDGKYTYSFSNEAVRTVMSKPDEYTYEIWKPYINLIRAGMSEEKLSELKNASLVRELCEEIKEFVKQDYLVKEGMDKYVFKMDGRYSSIVNDFATFFNTPLHMGGYDSMRYYSCDFGRDEAEKIPEYEELGYKVLLNFYKSNFGICDEKQLENGSYLYEA